ncbi:MAG: serine/threonine protein kinase [Planctomycetota bacterium]|nr:MAG: serine/threonine protein kinase [Planctomycetota bacterium]
MVQAAPLRSGLQPFPGYRLERILGRGGFSEVWAAYSPYGEPVALKFLPCDSSASAAREIRSLQAIRQLEHSHLIRMENVWCYQGYIVVAMEMAEGTLHDLLEAYMDQAGTPIAPEHVCLVLSDAAGALDFLNTRQHWINERWVGIQHCDVKPRNLLLVNDLVKVADFGLSSMMTAGIETRYRAGTLDYCAPEVFQGKLSNHTDQYALAVTYCQLRGGRLPFPDTPSSFDHRYTRPAPDLNMLSPPERSVVARALDPVPQNRWPSCGALFNQLCRIVCDGNEPKKPPKGKSGVRQASAVR